MSEIAEGIEMPEPNPRQLESAAAAPTEPLCCLECKRPWTDPRARWRAYIADPERCDGVAIDNRIVGLFCPDCSEQEFGWGAI